MTLDDDSAILMPPPSPPESRLLGDHWRASMRRRSLNSSISSLSNSPTSASISCAVYSPCSGWPSFHQPVPLRTVVVNVRVLTRVTNPQRCIRFQWRGEVARHFAKTRTLPEHSEPGILVVVTGNFLHEHHDPAPQGGIINSHERSDQP